MTPSVTITEHQIKALVVYMDGYHQGAFQRLPEGVADAVTDLLHKLEFANDGKLRLSGNMRVIHVEDAGQPHTAGGEDWCKGT